MTNYKHELAKKMRDHEVDRELQILIYGNCFELDGKIIDIMEVKTVVNNGVRSYFYKGETYSEAQMKETTDDN